MASRGEIWDIVGIWHSEKSIEKSIEQNAGNMTSHNNF